MKAIPQENTMVFGIHAVEELVRKNSKSIDKVYFTDKQKKGGLFELMKECKRQKLPYANIPDNKLDRMCRKTHQGVVAFKTVRPYDDETALWQAIDKVENPIILLPASLEDTGNFGAIIRSAAAFNVAAIVVERKGTVALNGTVAKTSAGMIEQATLVKPDNMLDLISKLKERGFTFIGASGYGSKPLQEIDFSGPTVIVTGGEHKGIPPYLKKECDALAAIPMADDVESLNVSVAAGIMLYEAVRQRR